MTTWHVHTCPGCTNRLAAATTDLLARMVAVHNGICVPLGWVQLEQMLAGVGR